MTCALAATAVVASLATAPMCPRVDRLAGVMAALVGTSDPPPKVDPAFEAAIRAIRATAPTPTRIRRHRR